MELGRAACKTVFDPNLEQGGNIKNTRRIHYGRVAAHRDIQQQRLTLREMMRIAARWLPSPKLPGS